MSKQNGNPGAGDAGVRETLAETEQGLHTEIADKSKTDLEPDREQIEIFVRVLFKRASRGTYVSLRSFYDDDSTKSFEIQCVLVDDRDRVIEAAYHQARRAANYAKRTIVFCPPAATFSNKRQARKIDVADGLTLTAEIDKHPRAAWALLEQLLGAATLVVASGGEWINPETGEVEPKLHLHWRLKKPARGDDRALLEEARTARASPSSAASSPKIPSVKSISRLRSRHCRQRRPLLHTPRTEMRRELDQIGVN